MAWTLVNYDVLGVAIYNYRQQTNCSLQLNIGDVVRIFNENDLWYFGYNVNNKAQRGIFPKSYICTKEAIINKDEPGSTDLIFSQPHLVKEITCVLLEWNCLWKRLYSTNDPSFLKVRVMMLDLIDYRSKILSGNLPKDEMKEIQKRVASVIDIGNSVLCLDLIVRDENGNVLNSEQTSTIQLFRQHEIALQKIKRESNASQIPVVVNTVQHSYGFFFCIRNVIYKLNEEAELVMFLYDCKDGKAFTENVVLKTDRGKLSKGVELINNFRAIFIDLSAKDLERSRVYLVCYVVRLGGLEFKEPEQRRASISKRQLAAEVRRPFGVIALEITDCLQGKLAVEDDKHLFAPLLQCGENDHLDATLKKLIAQKGEISQKDHRGQGLWCVMKLLKGDMNQIREDQPVLVHPPICVARKIGFPDIIIPGDVRNDLYLTLVGGEFSRGAKSSDRNVEVTVCLCNKSGNVIQDAIFFGSDTDIRSDYKSVVYYHDDKPKWFETLRISIPFDDYLGVHLRFTFRHRSSNETKDKNDKPFAMSYIHLVNENGTTILSGQHDLAVYKIDAKKFDINDTIYLKLPAVKTWITEGNKPTLGGLAFTVKDGFTVLTTVCSTKLTQNVDLLGLLRWWDTQNYLKATNISQAAQVKYLKESLMAFRKVDGEDVVKFLQDVLDALFNILMQDCDSDCYDDLVFECLVYIINLMSQKKYQHFQPMLDEYIAKNFSATLAYSKLMVVLQNHIDSAERSDSQEMAFQAMKAMGYLFKFIVTSRLRFSELNEGKGQEAFDDLLCNVFRSYSALMKSSSDSSLGIQGACLKHLPSTISDLLLVYDAGSLSQLVVDVLHSVPPGRLVLQGLMTLSDLVHSKLFSFPDCRSHLLPLAVSRIKALIEQNQKCNRCSSDTMDQQRSQTKLEKLLGPVPYNSSQSQNLREKAELSVRILCDILELLYHKEMDTTHADISIIVNSLLSTIIQSLISLEPGDNMQALLSSVMIAMFRQMSSSHYQEFVHRFLNADLLMFLVDILMVFQELVIRNVYPSDWSDMNMLQNSVILKALRYFSHIIRDHFSQPFKYQLWNNYFQCAIAFLTQAALQLEQFPASKRNKVLRHYGDMRRDAATEIKTMWFNLGQHKIQFVPGMAGLFLDMTLIPDTELRKSTISIFFDMMQCEYYSPRNAGDLYTNTKHEANYIKGHFIEFEKEIITQLDRLVEGGCGDEHYKVLFNDILGNLCENHTALRDKGLKFVSTVTRLMDQLLEYRSIQNDENKENQMGCTVNLLNYYSRIGRDEMYIRYLHKLCDLHLECDNFTEAAYTLQLHYNLLTWSDEIIPIALRSNRYSLCSLQIQLKEALLYDIINYFDQGKMWECALSACKELVMQYEDELFDFLQLADLLKRMSQFYDNIMKQIRPEPEYFRVAFYGRGFPAFLQNKVFVFRGKEYERLSDFSSRTLSRFPNAELMNKLTPPGDDIMDSPVQYLQINKVDPVMEDKRNRFSGKPVPLQVLGYHRVNHVQKFSFSRPFHKGPKNPENEFASLYLERTMLVVSDTLPGVLRWFPVVACNTFEVTPLQNAIETVEMAVRQLREMIISHRSDSTLPVNPLSMKLSGILDAAVMGGISNYEKAFFNPEYIKEHHDEAHHLEQLKQLIIAQIPLLELALDIHGDKAPPTLMPFHKRLVEKFMDMKTHVHEKYGESKMDAEAVPSPHAMNLGRSFSVSEPGTVELFDDNGVEPHSKVGALTKSLSSISSLSHSVLGFSPSSNLRNSFPLKSISTRSHSSFIKPYLSSPQTILRSHLRKDRESSRQTSSEQLTRTTSNTQWYTSDESNRNSTLIELNERLVPSRPLRPEVPRERRLSRPSSGQFVSPSKTNSYQSQNSDRDSFGTSTSDSTLSECDIPPPLPQKQRDTTDSASPSTVDIMNTSASSSSTLCNSTEHGDDVSTSLLNVSLPFDDGPPPTPPPKKPTMKLPP